MDLRIENARAQTEFERTKQLELTLAILREQASQRAASTPPHPSSEDPQSAVKVKGQNEQFSGVYQVNGLKPTPRVLQMTQESNEYLQWKRERIVETHCNGDVLSFAEVYDDFCRRSGKSNVSKIAVSKELKSLGMTAYLIHYQNHSIKGYKGFKWCDT